MFNPSSLFAFNSRSKNTPSHQSYVEVPPYVQEEDEISRQHVDKLEFDPELSPNIETDNCTSYENHQNIDKSTYVIGLITFVGDSARGILFPVLFNLTIRLGGSLIDLGYIVAMFSIGRLISSTPLGYLCDYLRHRKPLIIANTVLSLGAILWANALLMESLPVLYLAQLSLGLGSGTLGLTRSYISELVEPSKRTEMIALITALQYAGFTMSPILGSVLAAVGKVHLSEYWIYALPGYLIAILGITCVISLSTIFENIPIRPVFVSSSPKAVNQLTVQKLTEIQKHDEINISMLIIAMIILNFTSKGSIAVYETLGSQILIDDYQFTVFAVGMLVSIAGTIGTAQLMLFKSFWSKHFTDLELMLGGIIVMIIAQLILLSYGDIPSMNRFVLGMMIMYGIGYPIGHTAVLAAFSKIQKSGPQAALMSWFATSGSIARIAVPIGSDYLDTVLDNGPFCIVLMMLAISYVAIIILKPSICFYIASEVMDVSPTMWQHHHILDWIQVIIMLITACFALYALTYLMPGPTMLIRVH